VKSYRHRFKRIDPRVVAATKRLIEAKPWRGNPGRGGPGERRAAREAFRAWLEAASAAYGIRPPELVVGVRGTYGFYDPVLNIIALPKFSVFTLLHEFRHAYQYQKLFKVGCEENARGWSVSLVYAADPGFYQRAVKKNKSPFCLKNLTL
jgi:hypothetical protein